MFDQVNLRKKVHGDKIVTRKPKNYKILEMWLKKLKCHFLEPKNLFLAKYRL